MYQKSVDSILGVIRKVFWIPVIIIIIVIVDNNNNNVYVVKLLLCPQRYWRLGLDNELNDNVRIRAREQKCLEALSKTRERRRRCDMSRQIVPYSSSRSRKRSTVDCRKADERQVWSIRTGRTQSSSWNAAGAGLKISRSSAMYDSICC